MYIKLPLHCRYHGIHLLYIDVSRMINLLRWFTGSLTGRLLERASVPVEVVLEGRPDALTRLGIPAGLAVALAAVVLD